MMVMRKLQHRLALAGLQQPLRQIQPTLHRKDCNLRLPLWQLLRASTAAPTWPRPRWWCSPRARPDEYRFICRRRRDHLQQRRLPGLPDGDRAPYVVNWPTGEKEMLIVSVGTGSAALCAAGPDTGDLNSAPLRHPCPARLQTHQRHGWDMACRTLGACRFGGSRSIASVGDMVMVTESRTSTCPKLFQLCALRPRTHPYRARALDLPHLDPECLAARRHRWHRRPAGHQESLRTNVRFSAIIGVCNLRLICTGIGR